MIKTNKQLVYSVIALTAALFGLYSYIVINHKMLYMNMEYAMWHYASERTHNKNDEYFNLIALGDSKMKSAFVPEDFDDDQFNSINLALGGSSIVSGYYTLETYLENNEKPEYLLLAYSPTLLAFMPFYQFRTVHFQYLEDEEYQEIEKLSEEIDQHKTLGEGDYLDPEFYTGKYFTEFLNGIKELRYFGNVYMLDLLEKSKGHNFWGTEEYSDYVSEEATLTEFEPSAFINVYVEKMLMLAKEHEIKVYWYTLPVNEPTLENLNKDYLDSYHDHMDNLVTRYDLKLLSKTHSVDNSYFGDAHHVYRGAPMVTKSIKDGILADLNSQ